jgi:3-hydroxyisobutyrate dehydrogenase-like beta-hydroxyacid dehydrogenase
VLLLCVVDAFQIHEVLWGEQGAVAGLRAGHTVMLCPTIAPQELEHIAHALEQAGFAVIEAPLSGGPARARDGSMSLMLAAKAELLHRHDRLLQTLSGHRFVVGERLGDGARTKLVNNLLAGINLVGAAEALALAERLGLDGARTLGVIEASSGQSWIGSDRLRRALEGDFEPRAHMGLLGKDTRLAMAMAQSVGFVGPLGAPAAATFSRALAAGLAAEDDGALLKLLRQPPGSA